MDEEIRRLERSFQEAPSETTQQLLRHRQWRNGIKITPRPGDWVEIEGFNQITQGIFLRRGRLNIGITPAANFRTSWWDGHVIWPSRPPKPTYFIKTQTDLEFDVSIYGPDLEPAPSLAQLLSREIIETNSVHCFFSSIKRKLRLKIIRPLIPGAKLPWKQANTRTFSLKIVPS